MEYIDFFLKSNRLLLPPVGLLKQTSWERKSKNRAMALNSFLNSIFIKYLQWTGTLIYGQGGIGVMTLQVTARAASF